MIKKIYLTKDSKEVFILDEHSHPHREDLVHETLSKINTGDLSFIKTTVDLGRVIGLDHLVETTESDNIVYLDRREIGYDSRMVLGRKAQETSKVSVIIAKADDTIENGQIDGKYVLITLFEGDLGKPEPYGRNDTPENRNFWMNHALVPTDKELALILSK